jgi:hypothetical protein
VLQERIAISRKIIAIWKRIIDHHDFLNIFLLHTSTPNTFWHEILKMFFAWGEVQYLQEEIYNRD